MKTISRAFINGLLLLSLIPLVRAAELPSAKPEDVGISSEKLDRIQPVLKEFIEKQKTAGVVTLVARRGKVVKLDTLGMMDIADEKAMKPDTIFRIYSMSKPITTVAAMILFDEGLFQLDDPVSKYLPDFKDLKVYKNGGGADLQRPVTIRDLMRHTAGLTYGIFSDSGVDKIYLGKKVLDKKGTLQQMVEKLGKIPLLYQPGTHFHYSVAVDVLGRVVEVISGKPLDEFFEERIFKPLDMKDTAFFVPEEKLSRFATNYGPKDGGGLHPIDIPAKSDYAKKPTFFSGGGGLVSTARDYLRFCQMTLNGGELDGRRVLRQETVKMMTKNQLPDEAMPLSMRAIKRAGVGFGLGFSVRVAKSEIEPGVVGEYGWGGAASTHFWISPDDELIVIILQQYMPFQTLLELKLKPIIYDAITDRTTSGR